MDIGHALDEEGYCSKCCAIDPSNQQCPADGEMSREWEKLRAKLTAPRGYKTGPPKKRPFTTSSAKSDVSEDLLEPAEELPSPVSKIADRFIPIRTNFSGDVEMFNLRAQSRTTIAVGSSVDLNTDGIIDDRNGGRCVTSISAELIGAISPLLWIREGTLDPQYVGRIRVRIFNPSPTPIVLEEGTVVARIERRRYL